MANKKKGVNLITGWEVGIVRPVKTKSEIEEYNALLRARAKARREKEHRNKQK